MSSNINSAIPPLGTPTTAGVRANFGFAKAEIEALQTRIGFVDYNDTFTTGTPISVSPSTWTKLTNNKLGANTKIDALPSGVTNLWNTSNNQLDLSELPLNSMVDFRADIVVTTSAVNQVVKFRTKLSIGHASEFSLELSESFFKSTGAKTMALFGSFYMGSAPLQTNPGEFQLWSDASCTVVVNGWYIRIIKAIA